MVGGELPSWRRLLTGSYFPGWLLTETIDLDANDPGFSYFSNGSDLSQSFCFRWGVDVLRDLPDLTWDTMTSQLAHVTVPSGCRPNIGGSERAWEYFL